MSPEDERESFWQALHVVDDRVTAVESSMRTRNEFLEETVTKAVRLAMPHSLLSDAEYQWLKEEIERHRLSTAFRRKVLESSAIWAIPLVILGVLAVFREYMITHGMWAPSK